MRLEVSGKGVEMKDYLLGVRGAGGKMRCTGVGVRDKR